MWHYGPLVCQYIGLDVCVCIYMRGCDLIMGVDIYIYIYVYVSVCKHMLNMCIVNVYIYIYIYTRLIK